MTEPKVIRSEINREMATIACECKIKMAKLRKPLITVKYKRNQIYKQYAGLAQRQSDALVRHRSGFQNSYPAPMYQIYYI